jgi:putative tryptophan/tyrosine transport system substrate-binding protein
VKQNENPGGLLRPVRRRDLIAMLGCAAAFAPRTVLAQTAPKRPQIGFLGGASPENAKETVAALLDGLSALGYHDGETADIVWRFAEGHYERTPTLAQELIDRRCDVIVTVGNLGALAIKRIAPTEPVVAAVLFDPVRDGLAASEAHPGGSVTGILATVPGLAGKQVELTKEIVPNAKTISLLLNDKDVSGNMPRERAEVEAAASKLGFSLVVETASAPNQLAPAFDALAKARVDALIVPLDGMFFSERVQIAELAGAAHIPAIYATREHVEAGGLVSYGVNLPALFRHLATFVDKIIRGTPAGEIPIEFPTTLELWINQKTAKSFGLIIPSTLLVRADEVIE